MTTQTTTRTNAAALEIIENAIRENGILNDREAWANANRVYRAYRKYRNGETHMWDARMNAACDRAKRDGLVADEWDCDGPYLTTTALFTWLDCKYEPMPHVSEFMQVDNPDFVAYIANEISEGR